MRVVVYHTAELHCSIGYLNVNCTSIVNACLQLHEGVPCAVLRGICIMACSALIDEDSEYLILIRLCIVCVK